MGDIVLPIHNQYPYLDFEDQLGFLVIKTIDGESKPF
jgi:hypothetical protein